MSASLVLAGVEQGFDKCIDMAARNKPSPQQNLHKQASLTHTASYNKMLLTCRVIIKWRRDETTNGCRVGGDVAVYHPAEVSGQLLLFTFHKAAYTSGSSQIYIRLPSC